MKRHRLTPIGFAAVATLLTAVPGYAQKEVEAVRTEEASDRTIWETNALDMPRRDLHRDTCARTPGYMNGATCYKICGKLTFDPARRTLQWRNSHVGHSNPWRDCTEAAGCRIGAVEYYAQSQRGCTTAMIYKATPPGPPVPPGDPAVQSWDRDLRVISYKK
jgi:hypothetical protein